MLEACTDSVPGPRSNHALAYDAKRGVVVMLGGVGPIARAPHPTTLWAWDGKRWKCLADGGPPSRSDAELAYDIKRDRLILFGGRTREGREQQALGDTWEWDGRAWKQVALLGPAPAARVHMVLTYDPSAGVTVLHGGTSATADFSDTWAWNGDRWTRRASLDLSAIANGMVATPDGSLTLVTATPDTLTPKNDLLRLGVVRLDGSRWTTVASNGPGFSPHAPTAATADGLLLYAGWEPNQTSATHRWNGRAWTKVAGSPPRRRGTAIAYDARRDVVVMIGGETASGLTSEIWEWSAKAGWVRVAP